MKIKKKKRTKNTKKFKKDAFLLLPMILILLNFDKFLQKIFLKGKIYLQNRENTYK